MLITFFRIFFLIIYKHILFNISLTSCSLLFTLRIQCCACAIWIWFDSRIFRVIFIATVYLNSVDVKHWWWIRALLMLRCVYTFTFFTSPTLACVRQTVDRHSVRAFKKRCMPIAVTKWCDRRARFFSQSAKSVWCAMREMQEPCTFQLTVTSVWTRKQRKS